MTFELADHWVWDFWLADDGSTFHLYYLHAPKSLENPDLRHRNARIGHATSEDLVSWEDHGKVLDAGTAGSFDESATWTGSVVQGPDGVWRMFYTGARFHSALSHANTESIGLATSTDLHHWQKQPGPILEADPRWYEKLGDSPWPEEAWRDPWVFPSQDGNGWNMLITARGREGNTLERGVIGCAWSKDLGNWEARPPLSSVPSQFAHLEVLQMTEVEGRPVLLFSASASVNSSPTDSRGGIWAIDGLEFPGPFPAHEAVLLASEDLYSGRIVHDRRGQPVMLAFENQDGDTGFIGTISDPFPVRRSPAGSLYLDTEPGAAP